METTIIPPIPANVRDLRLKLIEGAAPYHNVHWPKHHLALVVRTVRTKHGVAATKGDFVLAEPMAPDAQHVIFWSDANKTCTLAAPDDIRYLTK